VRALVLSAVAAAIGTLGFVWSSVRRPVSLGRAIELRQGGASERSIGSEARLLGRSRSVLGSRLARGVTDLVESRGVAGTPAWRWLTTTVTLCGTSLEDVAVRSFSFAVAGAVLPLVGWVVLRGIADVSVVMALGCGTLCCAAGVVAPVVSLHRQGAVARRHARAAVGCFVDLVVLALAGGAGIEGALLEAAHVANDWVFDRIARALVRARDAGTPPWVALGELGRAMDVPDLVELAATVGLAGSEGARVQRALAARAVSLRRRELADAERQANAVTERLFLPSILLVAGFLLFVGYPAWTRILGGLS
jgi:tight adherence protein C